MRKDISGGRKDCKVSRHANKHTHVHETHKRWVRTRNHEKDRHTHTPENKNKNSIFLPVRNVGGKKSQGGISERNAQ